MFWFMFRDWGKDPRDHIEGYGYLWIFLGLVLLAAFVLLFPAVVFHSRTDAGAWHWNVRCTIACLAWWGVLLTCLGGFIAGRVNSPAVRELEMQAKLRERSPLPPPCQPQPLRPDLRLMWVTRFLEP